MLGATANTCTYIFDKISHAASLNKLARAYLSEMAIHLTGIYVNSLNGDSAARIARPTDQVWCFPVLLVWPGRPLPAKTRSLLTNWLFLGDNGLMGMADCLYDYH